MNTSLSRAPNFSEKQIWEKSRLRRVTDVTASKPSKRRLLMRLAAKDAGEARWYHGVIRPYRLIRTFFYSAGEG